MKTSTRYLLISIVAVLGILMLAAPFLLSGPDRVAPAQPAAAAAPSRVARASSKIAPPAAATALSLHDGAKLGNMTPIVVHLRQGEDVNSLDSKGRTPLHLAVENGHEKTSELLISKGANINAKDPAGLTPLHVAALNGHAQLVQFLLTKGADPSAVNGDGQTPLDLAVKNGHSLTANVLRSLEICDDHRTHPSMNAAGESNRIAWLD